MRETGKRGYQSIIKKKLKHEFPECEIRKLDPADIPGSPDLLILCPNKWATLEIKGSANSKKRPCQDYYVKKHNDMSFSSFIFPENEKEVFNGLRRHIKDSDADGRTKNGI